MAKSTTPEGLVKQTVKDLLAESHIIPAAKAGAKIDPAWGWYFMPAQNAMGVSGIPDFIGEFKGFFFAIETKKPGGSPTGLQALQITEIRRSCEAVFVVDGPESLEVVRDWLHSVLDEEVQDV